MTTAKDIMRTEYLTAEKGETLTRVNSRIKNEAFSEVLVFDKGRLIGVFSPSRSSMIVPSKENMEHMKIEKLVKKINTLDEGAELDEIMTKMSGTGFNIVPITDGGRIIGIVHLFDLLDAVKFRFDGWKVSDIELQKPAELFEYDRIGEAIQILHEYINNTILVKDKDNNAVGILNRYDLLRNLKLDSYKEDRRNSIGYKSEKEDVSTLPISDFIRDNTFKDKTFVSVNSKDSILEVVNLFKANNVTSLIVEDTSSLIRSQDILGNLERSQMVKIRAVDFVGLDGLEIDDIAIASIKDTAQRGFEKILGIIQQDAILKVHIKRRSASHENTRHEYIVVLHLDYSGNLLSIDEVREWDLKEAVKKALGELESRVNRVFRSQSAEGRDSAEAQNSES